MQEKTVVREKYNFWRFERRRIRSLWGLLGKEEKCDGSRESGAFTDISVWQMLRQILQEVNVIARKPFVKIVVLTVVCACLSGLAPFTRMLYMGQLPNLLSGTAKAVVIFAIFYALNELRDYVWQLCFMRSNFAKSEFNDMYGNYAEAKSYIEVLHKPRALFAVNGPGTLLSYAREIQQKKASILREFFYFASDMIICALSLAGLMAVTPVLLAVILFLQYVNAEFLLYDNKYFRHLDERFQRFNSLVARCNGQATAAAGLVQEADRVDTESRHILTRLVRSSRKRQQKYKFRETGEQLMRVLSDMVMAIAVAYVAVTDIIQTGDIGRLALISGAAFQLRLRCDSIIKHYFWMEDNKNRVVDLQKYLIVPKVLTRVCGKGQLTAADTTITFKNVSFAYPKLKRVEEIGYLTTVQHGEKVLDNVSVTVRPGELTVIAGLSGQGKTTLVKLIRHDYDAAGGEIFIGDKEVRTLSDEAISRHIAFVNQRVNFFDTTIRRNLVYMCPEANEEQIAEVLEAAGFAEDVAKFEDGLERRVGIGGSNLSGGQRQRLALARMFLSDKPILLLDEPTTGLDQVLSFKVMKKLKELAKIKTVLLVTHNPTEIALADRVLIINNGQVVADGEALQLTRKSEYLCASMSEQDVLSKRDLFVAHCQKAA